MRAKKLIASALSFALCAGSMTAASAASECTPNVNVSATKASSTAAAANDETSASVVTIRLGDINGDGYIDAADASAVLSAYAKKSIGASTGFTLTQTVASDVNMDSIIDAVDASNILSYYAYASTFTAKPLSIEGYLKNKRGSSDPVTTTAAPVTTTTTTATAASTTSTAASSTTSASSSTTAATTTTTAKPTTASTTSAKTTTSAAPTTTTTSKASTTTTTTITTTAATTTTTAKPATTTTTSASTTTTSTASTTSTTATTSDPKKVASISLSKTEINLKVNEGDISMVTMLPATAEDKSEIWTSSDSSIADVNFEGWITAISEGECTVTVQSAGNPKVKADIKVKVTDPQKVRGIKLSKTEITIPVGSSDISMVTMTPANAYNKGELWVSSNENVATVSDEGLITGISSGKCTVTVISKSNPDVKADIKVKVVGPKQPVSIDLSAYELDILTGTLGISYVTTNPETAYPITEIWTSSDPNIANVDRFGNIYGVSEGTCTVTVISEEDPDIKAEIKVNVHNRPLTTTTSAAKTTTTTSLTTTTASVSTTTTSAPTPPQLVITTHLIQSHNGATYVDGILIVNKSYSIDRNYPANGLTENTEKYFRLLTEDAAKLGLKIVCSSGFRSYDYQEQLYNNYVTTDGILTADTYSARPGHSEHQTGLAIDVNSISDDFIGTAECEWLAKNAHSYGFIIRYPKGKEAYTGFRYEPWHIRFLGVETATKVYESGLCLEEYLGIDSYYR